LSLKERDTHAASNRLVAVFKGQKVAVYTVDKTEISLSRQDLVELINVCSILFTVYLLLIVLAIIVHGFVLRNFLWKI